MLWPIVTLPLIHSTEMYDSYIQLSSCKGHMHAYEPVSTYNLLSGEFLGV